jgi:hypothetical protein
VAITAISSASLWAGKKVVEPFAGARTITFETGSGPLLNVDLQQGLGCLGAGVVVPAGRGVDGTTRPGAGPQKDGATWDADPGAFGAVPADWADLYITVTGPADHAVLLTGLTFHVTDKRPPLQGAFLQYADGCGGGGNFRYGEVRLDSPPPYWVDGPLPEWVTTERLKFPYKVTATDPEILYIHISGPTCWCSWTATLSWVDGAKSGRSVIDAGGRPFQLTGTPGLSRVAWSPAGNGTFTREVDPAPGMP